MSEVLPLTDVRVLELSGSVAASYCAKMLADAGADVIKVEPIGGDPLRTWSASGASASVGEPGVLFRLLAAGKGSVTFPDSTGLDSLELLASANVIVTDGAAGRDLQAIEAALPDLESVIVVSITPFGTTGPYVDEGIRGNEFILQAMCGSIGGRGWPGEEPLQAGGRLGEWVAGSYGAVAAAAALRRRRLTGAGDVIDVSIYESMIVTMGGLGAVSASVMGDRAPGMQRSLELPSIFATADGLVGFCTITAQQFADFLVMIDRADLIDDADLASFQGRSSRRDEFLGMVSEWAEKRTTAEIVEFASALRIPVSPIGTPETLSNIDHFKERGVLVNGADGLTRPRVPYRSDGFATRPPGAVPPLNSSASRTWPLLEKAPSASGSRDERPLAGVRIADLTAFWAGPSATQLLAALGADVVKIEGVRRPDGMRFSGGLPADVDKWWEWGPVFLASNNDKRGLSLELSLPRAQTIARDLIAVSDVVVENFSPRVMGNLGLDWPTVQSTNPRAVMIRMPAFGLDGPWRDRVGFAQTMEQASGMAWMTGTADGDPLIPRGVCDPLAGLHAAFATIVALEARDASGAGMQVECTMVEAAINVASEALLEYSVNGVLLRRDGNRGPGASPQGVFESADADDWLALSAGPDTDWPALARLLGREDLGLDPELATVEGRQRQADELESVVAGWANGRSVSDAVSSLRPCGVGVARVVRPSDLLVDVQLDSRAFWEKVAHPVVGTFMTTGMPFSLRSVADGWVRNPAPLFGEHNGDVLTDLGRTPEQIALLESDGIIASRPAGL